jgi:uroporphyrinogen decarboxylase
MRDRFLRAARGEPVDTAPIWLMRQAGRYMPEYRELRRRHPMKDVIRNAELAVEVTMQPLRRLDVDAAILFSDLLVPLWGMGEDFEIVEGRGPVLTRELDARMLASLPPIDLAQLEFTFAAVRALRRTLDRPLIGFTGGPFTFASYLIEGKPSRDYPKTRAFLHAHPSAWAALMTRLADNLADYLRAQIGAGAHAVQVFDSWAGVLSAADFRAHVLPYLSRMLTRVGATAPRIYFSTGSAHLFGAIAALPAEVIGVDWRVTLRSAAALLAGGDRSERDTVGERIGPRASHHLDPESVMFGRALQGNLDPVLLLGNEDDLWAAADTVLAEGRFAAGHIFNLGHGVLPETDPDRVRRLIDWIHERGGRTA